MLNELDETYQSNKDQIDSNVTNTPDNLETNRKQDKKNTETEDPKPRIVLTFRSEKSGAKSTNMKIVCTEEKHEDVTPRRSSRMKGVKWDSEDEIESNPKKIKILHQTLSENDETSDSSCTLKRSTRERSREFSDNVLANAIARKEKSYNEPSNQGPRLSRRIKPTAKVLANEELRMGLESQNNARLGLTPEKLPEDGVKTRRSARRKSFDSQISENNTSEKKKKKHHYDTTQQADVEVHVIDDDTQSINSEKKLKHLCGLGLKALDSNIEDDNSEIEDRDTEEEDYDPAAEENEDEGDDESEVISKLIEADDDTTETSDEEFYCSTEAAKSKHPRRSTRLCSSYAAGEYEEQSSPTLTENEQKLLPRRRSSRKSKFTDNLSMEYENIPAGGDEVSEATCPEEEANVVAACYCETPSTVHAAPNELVEPVFCQAVESVDTVRVGCCHKAMKDDFGEYIALVRAGPRAPFFLACKLHIMQLRKHLCCPACGLFCTQGIFYQCSQGHLFHLECGLPSNDTKPWLGCPHCGVYGQRWQPFNKDCAKVRLEMKCSNKRIFLPDQRLHSTPAYLGFSALHKSQVNYEPIIPEDLLPSPPIDLAQLCAEAENEVYVSSGSPEEELCDAIEAGETIEQLIPKIMRANVDGVVELRASGGAVHAAARAGHVGALFALRHARADLDRPDRHGRSPLQIAVTALLEKSNQSDKSDKEHNESAENTEAVEGNDGNTEKEENDDKEVKVEIETDGQKHENLMKVIRFLVAAGCDVNYPGSEGMTALHIAAQHGSEAVCSVILSAVNVEVDARDHGGWTPLVWAAENSHPDIVRVLLRAGADAAVTDREGNGAVHWCALGGDARSLLLLLHAVPHAHLAYNTHNDTPLHVAARQGHYACVVILLARGARTDVENSAGELPVDVCNGQCQNAISLNMQMTLAVQGKPTRYRLLNNDISRGREKNPIPCVNEVDDEVLPEVFKYVTQHVYPQTITIDYTINTLQGCTCKDECTSLSCACCVLGVRRWMQRGRLVHNFPYHEPPMLFECNHTCDCSAKKCGNNVVSEASKQGATFIRCEVFRTKTRGWGLRSTDTVLRGTPVAVYCGELITTADADMRSADQYMFALDVKSDLLQQCAEKVQLCVDAGKFGSAARFVNHSCHPNLAPVRVFTTTRDLRLPTVALFATTDIRPGDELTFDYGDKFWSVKSRWMKCECSSVDCKYPTKTDDTDS